MSLIRVGGRDDGGIDLQGWWWLPVETDHTGMVCARKRIRVIAQCKAEKKKIGPNYVREMEGVLHRFNADASKTDTVGLFISMSPFSKLTVQRAQSSSLPLALLHMPFGPAQLTQAGEPEDAPQEIPPDAIGSMIFNAALAGTFGVLDGEFEPRWEHAAKPGVAGRPMVWWRGQRMPNCLPEDSLGLKEVE
jgi:hypothetical protein